MQETQQVLQETPERQTLSQVEEQPWIEVLHPPSSQGN
jgi:hypothetical protein